MTRKMFWDDPYPTETAAAVTSVSGNDVTLDQTVFHASSGGQESDTGSIGGMRVVRARKDDNEIFSTMPEGHGLNPGDQVVVRIDWPRRYRLMRLHFAAEIVLELVYRKLPGISKVGAHRATETPGEGTGRSKDSGRWLAAGRA